MAGCFSKFYLMVMCTELVQAFFIQMNSSLALNIIIVVLQMILYNRTFFLLILIIIESQFIH